MNEFQNGDAVLAIDEWYGAYLGTYIGQRRFPAVGRSDILIRKCLHPPSDKAIFNPNATVHRTPYAPGSIQHFDERCVFASTAEIPIAR